MDTFFILFYCALFQIHSIFYNEYIKRTIFYKNIRKKDEKIKICMIGISILYMIVSKNPLF